MVGGIGIGFVQVLNVYGQVFVQVMLKFDIYEVLVIVIVYF